MYLIDTNICIYFMKNTYPGLTKRLLSYHPSALAVSAISVYELSYGAKKASGAKKQGSSWPCFSPRLQFFLLRPATPLPQGRSARTWNKRAH